MTDAAPGGKDAGTASVGDRFKNTFSSLSEKLKDSSLHDIKVNLIHRKHKM